jgi:predicted DCC family thiol-disulfide oxidoreductase YuxK
MKTAIDTSIFPLTLLYDGDCAVCRLEMEHLMTRNQAGLLRFVNIDAEEFKTSDYARALAAKGASAEAMHALIHAERPDGSFIIGIEALRLAYQATGLNWVLAATAWPVFKPVSVWFYAWFARNRFWISRSCAPFINWLARRRARATLKRQAACRDGRCDL